MLLGSAVVIDVEARINRNRNSRVLKVGPTLPLQIAPLCSYSEHYRVAANCQLLSVAKKLFAVLENEAIAQLTKNQNLYARRESNPNLLLGRQES